LALCFIFGRLGLPTRTRVGRLPQGVGAGLHPRRRLQPLSPRATSLQALMVHIGGPTCGALSLSPLLAVTALSPPSLIINLAYLRHTPYGGPFAPWRDGRSNRLWDRFLDGWRLFFIFLSFYFFSFIHSVQQPFIFHRHTYFTLILIPPHHLTSGVLPPDVTGYQGSSKLQLTASLHLPSW